MREEQMMGIALQPQIAAYAGREFIGGATLKGKRFLCVNAALKKVGEADSRKSALKIVVDAAKSRSIH
jgi:hypothetical protein